MISLDTGAEKEKQQLAERKAKLFMKHEAFENSPQLGITPIGKEALGRAKSALGLVTSFWRADEVRH